MSHQSEHKQRHTLIQSIILVLGVTWYPIKNMNHLSGRHKCTQHTHTWKISPSHTPLCYYFKMPDINAVYVLCSQRVLTHVHTDSMSKEIIAIIPGRCSNTCVSHSRNMHHFTFQHLQKQQQSQNRVHFQDR